MGKLVSFNDDEKANPSEVRAQSHGAVSLMRTGWQTAGFVGNVIVLRKEVFSEAQLTRRMYPHKL